MTRPPRPTPAEQADLDAFSGLAQLLEESIAPVRFRVATTDVERRASYRLRRDAVVDEGWAAADELPDGEERDEYDADAIHVGGWDGDDLVATARIVLPRVDRPLPTEQQFGTVVAPAGQVVDIGRTVLARSHRDADHRLFFALMGRLWLEAASTGHRHFCSCTVPRILDTYRQAGFVVRVLGPARTVLGVERVPFLIDGQASAAEVARRLA